VFDRHVRRLAAVVSSDGIIRALIQKVVEGSALSFLAVRLLENISVNEEPRRAIGASIFLLFHGIQFERLTSMLFMLHCSDSSGVSCCCIDADTRWRLDVIVCASPVFVDGNH
jgi:hypothetical protein